MIPIQFTNQDGKIYFTCPAEILKDAPEYGVPSAKIEGRNLSERAAVPILVDELHQTNNSKLPSRLIFANVVFGEAGANDLCEQFDLTSVTLDYCTNPEIFIRALAQRNAPILEQLEIKGVCGEVKDVENLMDAIADLPVKKLVLHDKNSLNFWTYLANHLYSFSLAEIVDLQGSALDPMFFMAICGESLKELHLSKCILGQNEINMIANCSQLSPNLNKIVLKDSQIDAFSLDTLLKELDRIKREIEVEFGGTEPVFSQLAFSPLRLTVASCQFAKVAFLTKNPFEGPPNSNVNSLFAGKAREAAPNTSSVELDVSLVQSEGHILFKIGPKEMAYYSQGGADLFFAFLQKNANLCTGIQMENCTLPPQGLIAFAQGCGKAEWLKILEVKDVRGDTEFLNELLRVKPQLKKLVFQCFEPANASPAIQAIASFLYENTSIESLILCDLDMGKAAEQVHKLAEALKTAQQLKELGFKSCYMCEVSAFYILEAISHLKLEKIQLRDAAEESFGPDAWQALISLPGLKVLDIGDNSLQQDWLENLMDSFSPSLEKIYLDRCGLEDPALLTPLMDRERLQGVDVGDNAFDAQAMAKFLDFLTSFPAFGRPAIAFTFTGRESFWTRREVYQAFHKHSRRAAAINFCDFNPYEGLLVSHAFSPLSDVSASLPAILKHNHGGGRTMAESLAFNNFGGNIPVGRTTRVPLQHPYDEMDWEISDSKFNIYSFTQQKNEENTALLLSELASLPALTQEFFQKVKGYRGDDDILTAETQKIVFEAMVEKLGHSLLPVKADGSCFFHTEALREKIASQPKPVVVNWETDSALGQDLRRDVLQFMIDNKDDYIDFLVEDGDLQRSVDIEVLLEAGILEADFEEAELSGIRNMPEVMSDIREQNGVTPSVLKEKLFEKYLERMASPSEYADQLEISALSKMRGLQIVIYDINYITHVEGGQLVGMPITGEAYEQKLILLRTNENHYDLLMPADAQVSMAARR